MPDSSPERIQHHPRRSQSRLVRLLTCLCAVGASVAAVSRTAEAQTDYYNTDAGRPIRIEDAYPVERRAFEIQLAPLRLERSRGGRYQWGLEPELAYGVLPRTHIEVGLPLAYHDGGSTNRTAGVAGLDLSVFHNLNVETSIPAFGIALSGLLPVGHLAPEKAHVSVKGIATRTFGWARFHVNAEYTLGDATPEPSSGTQAIGVSVEEVSRWMAGVALDRTFPLKSLLVTGEVFAEERLRDTADVHWSTGIGLRYQLSPRFNVDAGIGRRLTGDEQSWHMTFGAAVAFGLPWRP